MTTPEFRDPPQGHVPYCKGCGAERQGEWWDWEEDEIPCECGVVGQWEWKLRYPIRDRNADQPTGDG